MCVECGSSNQRCKTIYCDCNILTIQYNILCIDIVARLILLLMTSPWMKQSPYLAEDIDEEFKHFGLTAADWFDVICEDADESL